MAQTQQQAQQVQQIQKVISYNCAESFHPIGSVINRKRDIYLKRHLARDGSSGVKIIEDGNVNRQKEIQSELKNAGLQNILKLQELRYGTIDNAIARAKDKGIYADVSHIPTDIAGQKAFVEESQRKIAALKAELGLSDDDLQNIDANKLAELYKQKFAAAAASNASDNNNGGAQ